MSFLRIYNLYFAILYIEEMTPYRENAYLTTKKSETTIQNRLIVKISATQYLMDIN